MLKLSELCRSFSQVNKGVLNVHITLKYCESIIIWNPSIRCKMHKCVICEDASVVWLPVNVMEFLQC